MKVFQISEIQTLADEIKNLNKKITVIDGEDGLGKSTVIAPIIAEACQAHIVHLDDYLIKKQGTYKLKLDKLLTDINDKIKTEAVVIEGIMPIRILEKINITPDIYVYVEGSSARMNWGKEYGYYLGKTLNEIFDYVESQMQRITPSSKLNTFRKGLIEYHYNYRPFESADYKIVTDL